MKMDFKVNKKEFFGVGDIISRDLITYYLIIESGCYETYPIKLLDLDGYRIDKEYMNIEEISDDFKMVCKVGRYTLVED